MSAQAGNHNDHTADGHHGDAPAHATRKGYLIGFVLSVILTAIPFWLVMSGVLGSNSTTAIAVIALAMVQILVHMVYFLHMDAKSEDGWNLMALIFTIVLVVIAMSGSLWVMYHLVTNMMPVTPGEMMQMP